MVAKLVKDNPIKSTAGLVTAVSVIVGAVITVDSRYAHADDIKDIKTNQQAMVQELKQGQAQISAENRRDIRYATDQLRKQIIQDKIFELELIPVNKRTTVDTARLNKFQSDLTEINNRWAQPQQTK